MLLLGDLNNQEHGQPLPINQVKLTTTLKRNASTLSSMISFHSVILAILHAKNVMDLQN